jgi:hypothetical protein
MTFYPGTGMLVQVGRHVDRDATESAIRDPRPATRDL